MTRPCTVGTIPATTSLFQKRYIRPLVVPVAMALLWPCPWVLAQEVTARPPVGKSAAVFDADDRICRSQALSVPLATGRSLYAQCMQQRGNLVQFDTRTAGSTPLLNDQRSRSIQAANNFSDFIDRAAAQQPGFTPDFYTPSHWTKLPGNCLGFKAVESDRLECVYDAYSNIKTRLDSFFVAPQLQDYNSKFASHYADLLRRQAALGDVEAASQLCTFLRGHGRYFPVTQAEQQCTEASTWASSAASQLQAEIAKSPAAQAQRQRAATSAAYQAQVVANKVDETREQGEKDFRDAFATAFGSHIAATGDYSQIWSSPGAYYLATAGVSVQPEADSQKQLFDQLKKAGQEGYGPAWVWRTYLQAEGDTKQRMADANAALATGTPDGEFVYGVTELAQTDATEDTRKDATQHIVNGVKQGSLIGAMTMAIAFEKQKAYENCMAMADAVHQAGISLSEPQGYHCAMHLTPAQLGDAAKRAEEFSVKPPDGFSLADIQADHSGTETVENEIFEEQTQVRSATPPSSLFNTMYARYTTLQQRATDKSIAGWNSMLGGLGSIWGTLATPADTQVQTAGRTADAGFDQQKSSVLTVVSIKQYEGVWIGRFTARKQGDDISHAVRIKVKAEKNHWVLVSVDNGSGESAAPSSFSWVTSESSDETPMEDSVEDDFETYQWLDEYGFLD